MAKPWDKTKQKRERETQRLRSLHRYLIVCEDEKSSCFYLQSFPHDPKIVQIVTEGSAGNTISVVDKGIELKTRAQKDKVPYVQTYCVIDRDEHPVDRYRKAFEEARKHNDLRVIWANEAFELWYLLHFAYNDAAIDRHDLNRKLSKHLGESYDKADDQVFEKLAARKDAAHHNACRLEKVNSGEKSEADPDIRARG
jgi:hypothetical protein